jgi:hypothetical protein
VVTFLVLLCGVACVVGGLVLQAEIARHEPVRSAALWGCSVELRRWALAHGRPHGQAGRAVAPPCESRLRVFRIAGVPVWRQGQRVELPLQVAGMIGTLTARDFDREFDARFREARFSSLTPDWLAGGWLGERFRRANHLGADQFHK